MSHVSQIGLTWSERHSARGSYTAAVDLRSLLLHHEIGTLLVGAQSLMPLVVELLAKYSQSLFKKADNYITVIIKMIRVSMVFIDILLNFRR